MKEKFRLYYTNLRNFGQLFLLSRDTLSIMVWAMLGLIWAKSCQLPSLADEIPIKSKKPSKIQRLWRFIKNLKVIPKELALISAAEILGGFKGRIIYLTIDRTDIKDKWILFSEASIATHLESSVEKRRNFCQRAKRFTYYKSAHSPFLSSKSFLFPCIS